MPATLYVVSMLLSEPETESVPENKLSTVSRCRDSVNASAMRTCSFKTHAPDQTGHRSRPTHCRLDLTTWPTYLMPEGFRLDTPDSAIACCRHSSVFHFTSWSSPIRDRPKPWPTQCCARLRQRRYQLESTNPNDYPYGAEEDGDPVAGAAGVT